MGRRVWRAWRQRTWAACGLALEAVLWLGLARALLVLVPFRWLVTRAGLQRGQAVSLHPGTLPEARIQDIRQAVGTVSPYTPWVSNCLAQTLAAHGMLRRRRLPTQLYLGVATQADHTLAAHAWLRCGAGWVTGEVGAHRFTVVAMFGSVAARRDQARLTP